MSGEGHLGIVPLTAAMSYEVRAVDGVHDGDTLWLIVVVPRVASGPIGAHIKSDDSREKIRLARINAPELKAAGGIAARDAAIAWVQARQGFSATITGVDRYDRWIGEVFASLPGGQAESLNQYMLDSGNAVVYT